MKKIICLMMMLLLVCGCTIDESNKEYNEAMKANSLYHTIFEREGEIDVLRNEDGNNVRYCLDPEKDIAKVKNPSMSLQKSAAGDLFYYKNHWYNLGVDVSEDGKMLEAKLYVSDINGKKTTELYKVAEKELDINEPLDLPKLYIHNDKLYMIAFASLYIGTMEGTPYKVEMEDVWNVFLQDETLYVFREGYQGKAWTLFACDLNGNVKDVLYENCMVTYVDDAFLFYKKTGEEQQDKLYILNRNTQEEYCLEDALNCYGVLKDNGLYVFETRKNGYKTRTIHVMDETGEIVYEKDHNENSIIQYFKDYKIYVVKTALEEEWLGYFEIKEDKILDYVSIKINQ